MNNLNTKIKAAIRKGIVRKNIGFIIGTDIASPVKFPFGIRKVTEVATIIIPKDANIKVRILSSSITLIH